MKHLSFVILALLFGQLINAQVMKVMTYNIRLDVASDGPDRWDLRKEAMAKMLSEHHPEIIGLQEAIYHQLAYLDSCLTNYQYIGVGRDDGKRGGEFSPLLFDTTQLKALKSGTFWLSETPDTVSVGWDAALPRVCSWAHFERKADGRRFWCFNTHFDHVGQTARVNSAKLIVKQIEALNPHDEAVVVMGDLNSEPDNEVIAVLSENLSDAYVVSKTTVHSIEGTFNGFDLNAKADKRIDYVFVRHFIANRLIHSDERRGNGRYISDHFAVEAELAFQ